MYVYDLGSRMIFEVHFLWRPAEIVWVQYSYFPPDNGDTTLFHRPSNILRIYIRLCTSCCFCVRPTVIWPDVHLKRLAPRDINYMQFYLVGGFRPCMARQLTTINYHYYLVSSFFPHSCRTLGQILNRLAEYRRFLLGLMWPWGAGTSSSFSTLARHPSP